MIQGIGGGVNPKTGLKKKWIGGTAGQWGISAEPNPAPFMGGGSGGGSSPPPEDFSSPEPAPAHHQSFNPKTLNFDEFLKALQNDPSYLKAKSFIDQSGALEGSTLAADKARKMQWQGEQIRRVQEALKDAQLEITNDLAARGMIESGDTAWYQGHAQRRANESIYDIQFQVQDYLAGVEAAYQQHQIDRQMQLYQAQQQAYQNELQYYSTIGLPPQFGGVS